MPKPAYKVLIVEDNPLNLELARDVLEGSGFDVLAAQSAEVVGALARGYRPDVILMDLSLPGTDGLALTRMLKADPQTGTIPVVAVTAHAMKGDEQKALAAGCDGYITKPIDTRTFAKTVMGFADAARQRDRGAEAAARFGLPKSDAGGSASMTNL